MGFCVNIHFKLLWVWIKEHDCWFISWDFHKKEKLYLKPLWKTDNCLLKRVCHFASTSMSQVPVAPQPGQHLKLSVLWIGGTEIIVSWELAVVLDGISLMTQNVDHLYLFAICTSSLARFLLRSFTRNSTGLLAFLFGFKDSLYILDKHSWSVRSLLRFSLSLSLVFCFS